MLLLTSTSDLLRVVTSSAGTVDVHASWMDYSGSTVTPGRTNTAITTATTTTVVASPGSSTQRNVKTLHVRNKHATTSCTVNIIHTDGTTAVELHEAFLPPDSMLEYIEGVGFFTIQSDNSSTQITTAESASMQNMLKSDIGRAAVGTFVAISGTAYYVYVGRVARTTSMAFVEFYVTTAGAGAQTAEVGLFSSPAAPSKGGQTLTKIVATGTVDAVTATGVKRNTTTFAQSVSAGSHLWAAARFAMATTQPTCGGLAGDFSQAHVLTTTGGGVLTGLSTASGTVPAIATATISPDLRVTLM